MAGTRAASGKWRLGGASRRVSPQMPRPSPGSLSRIPWLLKHAVQRPWVQGSSVDRVLGSFSSASDLAWTASPLTASRRLSALSHLRRRVFGARTPRQMHVPKGSRAFPWRVRAACRGMCVRARGCPPQTRLTPQTQQRELPARPLPAPAGSGAGWTRQGLLSDRLPLTGTEGGQVRSAANHEIS